MRLRHIEFLLQETFTGIRRNLLMSAATVSAICVSLLLLGALRLVIANLDHAAVAFGDRFEMRAYLAPGVSATARRALSRQIAALPGVTGCRLVPKEEALPELVERLEGAVSLSDLRGRNPLPDAFVIKVKDPAGMGVVADRVRALPGVDEVTDTRDLAETWAAITHGVRRGGGIAVLLLLIAAAVVMGSTIQLTVHARRLEIGIMQLVGATHQCVRMPFLLEGAFHGAVGALLALGLLAAGYSYLFAQMQGVQRFVVFLELLPPTGALFRAQAGLLVGAGVALGLGSSFLSVRRYLGT